MTTWTIYSPPGSSVHGILQARILEWVAIPFSRGSSQAGDQTRVSCTTGRFMTVWATGKPICYYFYSKCPSLSSSPTSPSSPGWLLLFFECSAKSSSPLGSLFWILEWGRGSHPVFSVRQLAPIAAPPTPCCNHLLTGLFPFPDHTFLERRKDVFYFHYPSTLAHEVMALNNCLRNKSMNQWIHKGSQTKALWFFSYQVIRVIKDLDPSILRSLVRWLQRK